MKKSINEADIEMIGVIKEHFIALERPGTFTTEDIVGILDKLAEKFGGPAVEETAKLHPFAGQILGKIKDAIKNFGSYTYSDKGPHEVMDIDEIAEELRIYTSDTAIEILLQVARTGDDGAMCVSTILGNLEDWDELFENEELTEHY